VSTCKGQKNVRGCSHCSDGFSYTCRSVTGKATAGNRRYEFDSVLGESASQEEVYSEVRELVQSAQDGFNVCPASLTEYSLISSMWHAFAASANI
jgi:hypothetical protein